MATAEELSVVMPADWVAGSQQGRWRYEDYAAIPEDGRRYCSWKREYIVRLVPSVVELCCLLRYCRICL